MHADIREVKVIGSGELDDALWVLRDNLVSLKTTIDELRAYRPKDQNSYIELARELDTLLKEFEVIQKIGDETIAGMTPEQRKHFKQKIPGFFTILGWNKRIVDDGSIIYDS